MTHGFRQMTLISFVPLILCFLYLIIAFVVINEHNNDMLTEKRHSVQNRINDVCEIIEHEVSMNDDWETNDYAQTLGQIVSDIDAEYMKYASLYDSNFNRLSVSSPSYKDRPFNPFEYDEFRYAIQGESSGTVKLWFEDREKGVKGRTMYVYFRWTPDVPDPYLVIVGISKYSLVTKTSPLMLVGLFGMVLLAGISGILTVIFSRRQLLYRQDKEHRKQNESGGGRPWKRQ